jgi:hypothetical protein
LFGPTQLPIIFQWHLHIVPPVFSYIPHLLVCIFNKYCWNCSRPKFSWNTALWALNNNHSINYLAFQYLTLSVLDDIYARNGSCLRFHYYHYVRPYFCLWTISPPRYHPHDIQSFIRLVDMLREGMQLYHLFTVVSQ